MAMKYALSIEDIASIVVVLVISASIGIYFRFSGGRQRTTTEFLMAGRSMSPFPVVFSLIVTFVSAVMMLGVPSEVYEYGLYRMIAYIFSTVSNVISAYIFLPVYFQMGESVSVYEYLERRFGTLTRKVSSVLFVLQQVFYMAVVLYAPALALSAVTDIELYVSITSIGGICTLYCCMGGMKAVLWTDVFQAIIMYICIFAILIRGIVLAKSIPDALRAAHSHEISFFSFDPSVRYTIWNCVLYGFLYGLCNYGCNQAQVQRMLSVKSLKLSQRAVIVSVPLAIIFIVINFFVGIVMLANYPKNQDPVPCKIDERDKIVPYFIMNSFKEFPGLAGLCIAGIFSGSLSTVSSSVNSLAAVTMEDFVRPYFETRLKITDSMAAFLVKVFACSYGIIGMACSFLIQKKGLVYAYTVVYGTISGPVLGLFTLGMMTVTANEKGALRGLMSGILTTLTLGIVAFNKMTRCKLICDKPTETTGIVFMRNATSTTDMLTSTTSATDMLTAMTSPTYMPTSMTSTTDMFTSITDAINSTAYSIASTTSTATKCEKKEWLSVMWLLTIGFTVTVGIGYISSFLARRSKRPDQKKPTDIDPNLLSPLVRKWLAKPLPQYIQEDAEELQKLNGKLEA